MVPTFTPSGPTVDPATVGVPLDPCAALISPEDVANVLGLDREKTAVQAVVGQPSPTVGRTEKLDCTYVAARGGPLFTLRTGTFVTPEAAREQWQRNSGLEDGQRQDVTIGTAPGVLFVRPSELVLSLVDGARTLTVRVPDRTVPEGRARENLIVDFARRALKIDPGTPARAGAD